MRLMGVEPTRSKNTSTSSLTVCQFQHSRKIDMYESIQTMMSKNLQRDLIQYTNVLRVPLESGLL